VSQATAERVQRLQFPDKPTQAWTTGRGLVAPRFGLQGVGSRGAARPSPSNRPTRPSTVTALPASAFACSRRQGGPARPRQRHNYNRVRCPCGMATRAIARRDHTAENTHRTSVRRRRRWIEIFLLSKLSRRLFLPPSQGASVTASVTRTR
jgi:hypothetical protein